MTTGDGLQSGGRASEAELLQRLAERRTNYERAQAEAHRSARFTRIFSRRKHAEAQASDRWNAAKPVKGLRRRPVAAYLTVTLVSATTVGAVALLALVSGGDAASNEPAAIAARAPTTMESSTTVLASTASTPVETATEPAAVNTPAKVPETARKPADDPAVAAPAAERGGTATATETGARLRPTTEDLPRSAAAAPAPTADAVAVALALRLPSTPSETVAGLPTDMLTTGSIVSPVGQNANVTAAVDAGGAASMARWTIADAEQTAPVSTPTAGYGEAEVALLETTAEEDTTLDEVAEAELESKPTASVNVSVNMRAKPDNDAKVIAVLPKGRAVEVLGCKMWCEVSADGKRGFVFKNFVNRKG